MCLYINQEKTDGIKKEFPQEFFVYKVARIQDGKLYSPLFPTEINLNERLIATGEAGTREIESGASPREIEAGAIHTLLKLEDAKQYRALLPLTPKYRGESLSELNFVILKCRVLLSDFIAFGRSGLNAYYHHYLFYSAVAFTKILPVEIIHEQVS